MDGLTSIRYLKALAAGQGDRRAALGYVEGNPQWADQPILKAALGGLESSAIGPGRVAADFLAALRPTTIVGRLPLRRVPARTPLLTMVGGATAYWVGEGKARPLSLGSFARDPEGLKPLAVAALTVATEEALQDKSIDAERALLADLLAACREALDRAFIDAANAGVPDQKPASVTSGAPAIASSGGTMAALLSDMRAAFAAAVAAGARLSSSFWVAPGTLAADIALLRGNDGIALPILASDAAPAGQLALVDASQVAYVEEAAELRTSPSGMVEMSTTPTGDTLAPTAASSMVSLFQAGAVALLAQLSVNWKVWRPGAVQVITGIDLA